VTRELEDHALMKRIARGDAGAFRELTDQHEKAITTYAHRLLWNQAEAEELTQETFLRAWQRASDYQPKARASTWLHRIVRNLAIDRLRQKKSRGDHFGLDDERDTAPESGRPSLLLSRKTTALSVQEAVASLPERQRSAISLCHEQGLSNPEIAEVLECSVDAVESLLSRGRRSLRTLMEERGLSPQSSGAKA